MFKFLKQKLGIDDLQKTIAQIPTINERYLKLLTPMESIYTLLLREEGDDSMIMHHLRCMGLCGGWKAKEQYEKGRKHGKAQEQNQ